MKHIKYLGAAALALLLLPATTFAKDKDKNEGTLLLSSPVQVGSTTLEPGTYHVTLQATDKSGNAKTRTVTLIIKHPKKTKSTR